MNECYQVLVCVYQWLQQLTRLAKVSERPLNSLYPTFLQNEKELEQFLINFLKNYEVKYESDREKKSSSPGV